MGCSFGYRPGKGARDAVRELSRTLQNGPYPYRVEADIKGFFDPIDHEQLLAMRAERLDDKPFLKRIRKGLKAGIREAEGQVIHPATGTPQGGIVSPVLANLSLPHALDVWVEATVKAPCRGAAHLGRYADDLVCAFEDNTDAERFYRVLGKRLGRFGLEVAEDKTPLLRFSPVARRQSVAVEFLGFEFRWGLSRWRKPIIKRRTAAKKYRASLANLKAWCQQHAPMPKRVLLGKLNAKLRGYYQY